MTVFLPRGSGSAYQRNITKTLSSPVPEDSREQVRQILKNNNELTDRADSVLSTETATAWGTKQKYGDAYDMMTLDDTTLLIVSGTIRYLQEIDLVFNKPRPQISKALWGDPSYPCVWFSDDAPTQVEYQVSTLEEHLKKETVGFDGIFTADQSYFESIDSGTLDAVGGEESLLTGMKNGDQLTKILTSYMQSAVNQTQANDDILTDIEAVIQDSLQVIFYGPPGTGKTYYARAFARENYTHRNNKLWEFITFHPAFSYEEFIEGIRAETDDGGSVTYPTKKGVFREICEDAAESNEEYLLIIDEINRGNIASLFGELITLLEEDKRGEEITLPYSGERFSVPDNLHIIGTMNTADRSIASIDIALRRRFSHMEFPPSTQAFMSAEGFGSREELQAASQDGDLAAQSILAIEVINQALMKEGLESGKKIGHSYAMDATDNADIVRTWKYEILPLLNEYFFDNYTKIREILEDHNNQLIDDKNKTFRNFDSTDLEKVLSRLIN